MKGFPQARHPEVDRVESLTEEEEVVARRATENDPLLSAYMKDIRQYPLLTRDDEARLATKIEAGNNAYDRLGSAGKQITAYEKRELRKLVREGKDAERALVQSNLHQVVEIALE